jgi:hypothetical protein
MRFPLPTSMLALPLLFTGCEGSQAVPPVAREETGPHQGALHRLPDNTGVVEIVNEPEVTDRRSNPTTAIVVYFLHSDGKTAMTPAPSDVRVEVDEGRNQTRTLALKADPRSADASGGSRFASEAGPYLLEGLRGKLIANIAGKPVEQTFAGGH